MIQGYGAGARGSPAEVLAFSLRLISRVMTIPDGCHLPERYVAPAWFADGFHCPHCGFYANQSWQEEYDGGGRATLQRVDGLVASYCDHCHKYSVWVSGRMVYPVSSIAPLPSEDMPEDVKADFLEARNVVNASPRSAAALLRLALQKLMIHLGESGDNINDDIGRLVKKGLSPSMQKALDSVRVIGNNAVHPGQVDLKDDAETAITLFGLVNLVVDVMITQPKKIEELYGRLPEPVKEAIKKRNGTLSAEGARLGPDSR